VCRRSSTACLTCRHFRRSVAAQLGYCGLDRQRQPLTGNEIRACWESGPDAAAPSIAAAAELAVRPTRPMPVTTVPVMAPGRTFVEVGQTTPVVRSSRRSAPADGSGDESEPAVPAGPQPRWSLWDDLGA
jgi:hypothetical protein